MSFIFRTPYAIAALGLLLSAGLSFFTCVPERDVAMRFAPMADAFASGDWTYAFHPRTPPLLPASAGILAFLFGIGGFAAAKMASSLFFVAGVFPLFGIFKRVFDLRTALLGSLLYVLSSHILRLASSGLRESAKGFAFILAVYGLISLYQERGRIAGYLWASLGSALLLLCRADGLLFACLILAFAGIFEFWNARRPQAPWRSSLALLAAVLIVSPFLLYNYRVVGYPVPEGRFAPMIERLSASVSKASPAVSQALPAPSAAPSSAGQSSEQPVSLPANSASLAASAQDVDDGSSEKVPKVNNLSFFIFSFLKGFYPYFMALSLAVVFFRLFKRKFTAEEAILLSALLGHAVLVVLQIALSDKYLYVSRRYLLPVAPLGFGWAALGLLMVKDKLESHLSKPRDNAVFAAAIAVLALAMIADAAGPQLKLVTSKRKSQSRQVSCLAIEWIRSDYKGPAKEDLPFDAIRYVPNRRPIVYEGDFHGVAYLSGGKRLSEDELASALSAKSPDYLLLQSKADKDLAASSGYSELKTFSSGGISCSIYGRGQP